MLGKKVCSKKTGYPGVGEVMGIEHPFLWCYCHSVPLGISPKDYADTLIRWNTLYPDWLRKPVIDVWYDEPRKTVSLEEIKIAQPDLSDFEVQEMFDNIPLRNAISYPFDDLEIVE